MELLSEILSHVVYLRLIYDVENTKIRTTYDQRQKNRSDSLLDTVLRKI